MTGRGTTCGFMLLVLALVAGPVAAESLTAVSLAPAEAPDPADHPYRTAELSITNGGDIAIRSIQLRESAGGPQIVLRTTIPPGSQQTCLIPLPATSVQQNYAVSLLDAAGRPVSMSPLPGCAITWPAESVNTDTLIDPGLHAEWWDELPCWPARLVRTTFLAAVLACLALAATLVLRRPALRIGAVLLVLVAASTGMWQLLSRQQTVIVTEDPDRGIVVVQCRRSGPWTAPGQRLAPVYDRAEQMARDRTTLILGGDDPGVHALLRPDDVRLFYRMGRPATAPAPR